MSTIPVFTIKIEGMPGPTCHSIPDLLECIKSDLEHSLYMANDGDFVDLSVKVDSMTQEAFDALPEWGGY